MSHPTTIWHAFWDSLRTTYRNFRRVVATRKEHSGPALVVPRTIEDTTAILGRRCFAPNWEFSYYKRGEDLNLARVEYELRETRNHEYVWWQTHVRGWHHDDDSVRLRAHYELEPTEYDQDHLDGVGVDVNTGMDILAEILTQEGVDFERYEYLPSDSPE